MKMQGVEILLNYCSPIKFKKTKKSKNVDNHCPWCIKIWLEITAQFLTCVLHSFEGFILIYNTFPAFVYNNK